MSSSFQGRLWELAPSIQALSSEFTPFFADLSPWHSCNRDLWFSSAWAPFRFAFSGHLRYCVGDICDRSTSKTRHSWKFQDLSWPRCSKLNLIVPSRTAPLVLSPLLDQEWKEMWPPWGLRRPTLLAGLEEWSNLKPPSRFSAFGKTRQKHFVRSLIFLSIGHPILWGQTRILTTSLPFSE